MTALPPPPIRRARTLLFSATALWGLSFPLLRGLELAQGAQATGVPPAALAAADMAVRFLCAALILLPIYGRELATLSRREWSQAGGLAFFAGAGLFLQTLGLLWTDASVSAFLTQLYTLIVPLIVAFRDRRWPTTRTVGSCLLVLVGAALLSPGLLAHFTLALGETVILLSAIFFSGQIVWVERPLYAANRAGPVTALMFGLMGIFFAAAYPLLGGVPAAVPRLFATPGLIALMAATVLLCTVINFFIMNKWQRWVSATEAGLIYCLEPVIATALAAFLPAIISIVARVNYANEALGWNLALGGGLILGATILVATEPRLVAPHIPTRPGDSKRLAFHK
jgi:drug/metabolite transporter (DMT)-like permease